MSVEAIAGLDERAHQQLDALERRLLAFAPLLDQPVEHLFLPGLYVRKITNPAGSLVTTKVHRTEHPFFVMQGTAWVLGPDGPRELRAGHVGVTQPGTRRVIFAGTFNDAGDPVASEDVVWVTVHALSPDEMAEPDQERRIGMIEERIIERRELAGGETAHELFLDALTTQKELSKMSQAMVEYLFNHDLVTPPGDATEEEIYETILANAHAAREKAAAECREFADLHPVREDVARDVARRIFEMGGER